MENCNYDKLGSSRMGKANGSGEGGKKGALRDHMERNSSESREGAHQTQERKRKKKCQER